MREDGCGDLREEEGIRDQQQQPRRTPGAAQLAAMLRPFEAAMVLIESENTGIPLLEKLFGWS
jgi:hypothetical protein